MYYRGRNKGDTRRISTGVVEWDNNLFCTREIRYAREYGKDIQKIEIKENVKIVVEGSKEFRGYFGKRKETHTILEWGVYILREARKYGIDIVEFERQGDVGTVIINRGVIKRVTEV